METLLFGYLGLGTELGGKGINFLGLRKFGFGIWVCCGVGVEDEGLYKCYTHATLATVCRDRLPNRPSFGADVFDKRPREQHAHNASKTIRC